ncbi:MAG TPA: hypothetical protein VMY88_03510 [Acidimicrobiales bacterium]|nr:hypothetical protein [Acidimicrobiales bacterium]
MSEAVTVLFGGPSPEHDISILTGLQAARALSSGGRKVRAVYWSKTGEFGDVRPELEAEAFLKGGDAVGATPLRLIVGEGLVAPGRLGRPGKQLETGVVLVCCHGGPGEDGSIQAALDLSGITYAGPTAAGAALGMDKLAFGSVVESAGLPTLPRVAVDVAGDNKPAFDAPYIIKPRFGGSSIGIEVVADWQAALALASNSVHLRAGAIAEPWRGDAVDVQVSVRAWPALSLSPIEKPVRAAGGKGGILGYADKYVGGEGMASAPRELPAILPSDIEARVIECGQALGGLVGLRGVSRIDFLWDENAGDLLVNEINTIPGSLSKYLWEAATPAVPFVQLLDDLIAEAAARPSVHWSTQGADGTALRSAGTIASKLG